MPALTVATPFLADACETTGSGFQAPSVTCSFFNDPVGSGQYVTSLRTMILLGVGVVAIVWFFLAAARRAAVIPGKLQFTGEGLYGFVRNGIAIEIIGRQGRRWAGFLASLFIFILVLNVLEIIPFAEIPVTSHFAVPVFLAGLIWLIYNGLGIRKHGLVGYLKLQTVIPGVPVFMHVLLIPIEFLSNIILRPFTMAVRLFANMFAGHMLVGVAAAGTLYLLESGGSGYVSFLLPGAASIALVFFELLVCLLQAYVFTLLAAIYIESSLAESH